MKKLLLQYTQVVGMKCVNMFIMTNWFSLLYNLLFEVVIMVHFNGFEGQQVH